MIHASPVIYLLGGTLDITYVFSCPRFAFSNMLNNHRSGYRIEGLNPLRLAESAPSQCMFMTDQILVCCE